MTKLLKKRKSVASPTKTFNINLVNYDTEHVTERDHAGLKECNAFCEENGITWIQVIGIDHPKDLAQLGSQLHLNSVMIEDILMSGERSKLENYNDSLFIVMRLLKFNEETKAAEDEKVIIIVDKNRVITCTERDRELFESVHERIRHSANRIRQKGTDFLAYAIIDAIVDNYFTILEKVDDQLDILEEELVNHPSSYTLYKIQLAKRQIVLLRRSIWPTREVISRFLRVEAAVIDPTTRVFLQEVYDHTIQAIDTIESFRDIVGGLLDIYLSTMSQRLNEIMKVLTVVATIFYPLSFITGIYGMNFDYMPELHSKWAYPSVLAAMVFAAGSMLYFFRRRQWI